MLLGEWSLQCTHLKERHYQRKGSQCSSNKWLYNLLKVTVTESHGLWINCNKKLSEARGVDTMDLTAINVMVADQYHQGIHDLLTHGFTFFQQDLYKLLDQATKVKQHWLNSVMIAREYKACSYGEKACHCAKRKTLCQWI